MSAMDIYIKKLKEENEKKTELINKKIKELKEKEKEELKEIENTLEQTKEHERFKPSETSVESIILPIDISHYLQ